MPNLYDLHGKSVVITGAAKGIGRAIAELLVASGAAVRIWDTNPTQVPGASSDTVDVTDSGAIEAALSRLPHPEEPDVLVNNGLSEIIALTASVPRSRIMSVTIGPGATQFTKTLRLASSRLSALVNAMTPALAAEQAASVARPSLPANEPMFTIRPRPARSMRGRMA